MSAKGTWPAGAWPLILALAAGCGGPARGAETKAPLAMHDASMITVFSGGRPVLSYRHGDAPFKPYVMNLGTPSGVQILRDSPSDHVHHRGVMFAVEIDKVDFWAETKNSGKQVPDGEATVVPGPDRGGVATLRILQRLRWVPAGAEKPSVTEERTIAIHAGVAPSATLLTWRTRLVPAGGKEKVTVTGSHYQGLGMRFAQSMDGVDAFLHAAGAVGPVVRGTEHVTPSSWSAITAPADGKPVTAVLFDHPKNARAPAGMFTMFKPFSYLSATPNVWKQPLEVKAGESLDLRYGVAALDGAATRETLEALHKAWLAVAGD